MLASHCLRAGLRWLRLELDRVLYQRLRLCVLCLALCIFYLGVCLWYFLGVYLVFGGVYLVNQKGSILEIQHKRRYHTKGAIGSRYLLVLEDPKS